MHASLSGALRLLIGTWVCFASNSAIAQQSSKQFDKVQPETSSAVATAVAGVQLYVGVEGGYDSNLDNRVIRTGSAYEMLQAGLNGNFKVTEQESYSLSLRARNYWYNDLNLSDRYDVDAAVGARYDFSNETSLKVGTSWVRDAITVYRTDIFKSYADLVHETVETRLRLKFDSRTELSFADQKPGTLDPDVFSVTRNKAFDFTKNGGTASLLIFRKQFLAPFIIGNATNIDYFNQDPNPAIDRNANEYWGVAGVRVTLSPSLYVDAGARANRRDFDDLLFRHFSSSSFDARMNWKVSNDLTLNAVFERVIREPTTSFGLADDVKTYEVRLDYKSGPWTLYAKAFLDEMRPIGDNFNFKKYNWGLGVINALNQSTDIYADYSGKYAKDSISGDSYTRNSAGAGIKIKF